LNSEVGKNEGATPRTWALVLAAGASRRMGAPKQLLDWQGRPLVLHAVETAQAVFGSRTLVVTGCCANQVQGVLARTGMLEVFNPEWSEGLAASIRVGVAALPADCEGVMICSCDQPAVDEGALRSLLSKAGAGNMVAASYAGTIGIPAWFCREYFPALMALKGEQGAKSLLRACERRIEVPMPLARLDLDHPGDLATVARAVNIEASEERRGE
jgi:molybdenum cofactor cytidylyltransferase